MTRAWMVLGVDPGEQGAVARIRVGAGCDRPQLEDLVDADKRMRVRRLVAGSDLVVIEGQQASPQMGVSSAFGLGMAYGRLLEAVEVGAEAARREIVVAWPTAWRGSYGLAGGRSGKTAGLELAKRLLGEQGGQLVRHDQADAVLLAWWGWRKHLLARVVQELQVKPVS